MDFGIEWSAKVECLSVNCDIVDGHEEGAF